MSKYGWDFTLPDSFGEMQSQLNKLAESTRAIAETLNTVIPHYDFGMLSAAWNNCLNQYKGVFREIIDMQSTAISMLSLIDTSIYESFINSQQAIKNALTNVDWSWVTEAYAQEQFDGIEPIAEELLTQEIRAEMAEDITQVLSNPEEMQSASRSKYLQWKARNPGVAAFFLDILYPLLLVLIGALISQGLARLDKNSQVYAEPTATSNVVYNLTVENNITIIGDAPYYYEVEFTNPENGEVVTGYVYKGNITVEEQTETEDAEESEVTEALEAIPDTTTSQTGQAE